MRHGITGYTSGCRCGTCTGAWREYGREYAWDVAHGRPRTVPSKPVVRHLDWLYAAGHTAGSISAATGIAVATICSIRAIPRKRVRADIADALLGMYVDDVVIGERNMVPAYPFRPLLRALLDSGMRHEDLSRALGGANTSHLLLQHRITGRTANKIRVLAQLRARHGLMDVAP